MGTPFKMKGSPFQRNFGIGSPMTKKPGKLQKLWDRYGPSINPYTKTEEGIHKGEVIKTTSPGWGKTKTTEFTSSKSSELSQNTKDWLKKK